MPFLCGKISPSSAVLKVLQLLDSHVHDCLMKTLLELKCVFCVTTILVLAGSKTGF